MNIDLNSENLVLRTGADTTHEDASDWYGAYGAHVSTQHCGDVDVQTCEYGWLDEGLTEGDWRDEALADITAPSEGDFAACDDNPGDLADAFRRGDEDDIQAWIDYLRRDDYPDTSLERAGNDLADDIEEALAKVAMVNRIADRSDSYAEAAMRDAEPKMDGSEIEELLDLARGVKEAAEAVCERLDAVVEAYESGDIDAVVAALEEAKSLESEHGDWPATAQLAGKLLEDKVETSIVDTNKPA